MSLLVFYSKRFRSSRRKTAAHVFIKKFDFVCVCSPFSRRCVWPCLCAKRTEVSVRCLALLVPILFLGTLELTDWLVRLAKIPSGSSYLRQTALGSQVYAPAHWLFFFISTESPVQVLTPAQSVLRRSVISPSPCLGLWLSFLRPTSLAMLTLNSVSFGMSVNIVVSSCHLFCISCLCVL